jgi:hypothetical protein
VAASEAQYQLNPGTKDPLGYVIAGGFGLIGARAAYTPADSFRKAGWPAVRLPTDINDWLDYSRIFGGGLIRSVGVTLASNLVQTARGATGK